MSAAASFNSKIWGSTLLSQRILMKAEYKNNMKRLRHLAEERHIQYRKEYIQHVKDRIEENKLKVAEESRKIKEVHASQNKKTILNMGWDSALKQMIEERDRKRANAKIIFEKKRALESRVRREWLIEMNDKCNLWNKSPDEMKYAKYRLLNKKILERLPKSGNYVLDRHEMVDDFGRSLEYDEKDNYQGPERTATEKLAYILSNNLPLPSDQKPLDVKDQPLSIDPSSPEYEEYLEYVKYAKERQKIKDQKLRESSELSQAHRLNNEDALVNHTSGYQYDLDTEASDSYLDYSTSTGTLTETVEGEELEHEDEDSEGYEEFEDDVEDEDEEGDYEEDSDQLKR